MNQLKTQQIAMQEMIDQNVHWTRLNERQIIVYTSSDGNGSHITNQDILKDYLEAHGFFEFERGFDRHCGKGTQVFNQLGVKRKTA